MEERNTIRRRQCKREVKQLRKVQIKRLKFGIKPLTVITFEANEAAASVEI